MFFTHFQVSTMRNELRNEPLNHSKMTASDLALRQLTFKNIETLFNKKMRNNTAEIILVDHNYSRRDLYGYHLRPTKNLFIHKVPNQHIENIDVTSVPSSPPLQYDSHKSRQVMEECDKFHNFARSSKFEETNDNIYWEDSINRTGWSPRQDALFQEVVKILGTDRLARLALQGVWSEPAKRRALVNRSAQRFREILASYSWDSSLTQWLHGLLIDSLDVSYLSAYLDILQTLRIRIPQLVDRLVAGYGSGIVQEGMNYLLKRPWDPAATSINSQKLGKLPGNPIIILVPSYLKKQASVTPRSNFWAGHLSHLATLITVLPTSGTISSKMTAPAYLEQMVSVTRSYLANARSDYPGRPLILVGWRSGAAIALQTAVTEPVAAVVCLGFATRTVEGQRGDPDDSIYTISCPVLFATGEFSNTARPEELEEIRSKMLGQTGLIVVGSSDDCLRMMRRHKISFGVTQSLVDRKVLEEIGDFLGSVLLMPLNQPRPDRHPTPSPYRRRRISTGSSENTEYLPYGGEPTAKQLRLTLPTPQPKTLNGNTPSSRRGRKPGSTNRVKKYMLESKPVKTLQTLTPVRKPIEVSSPNTTDVTLAVGSVASLASSGPIIRTGAPQTTTTTLTPAAQHKTFRIHAGRLSMSASQNTITSAAPPADVMPLRLSDSISSVGTPHLLVMTSSHSTHNGIARAAEPTKQEGTVKVISSPRVVTPRPARGRPGRPSNRVTFASTDKIVPGQNNVYLVSDKRTPGASVKMTSTLKSTTAKITKAGSLLGNRLAMEKRFVTSPSSSIQQKPMIVSHRAIVSSASKDGESQDKPLVIVKNRTLADGDHEGPKSVMYVQRASAEGTDSERSVMKIVKNRALVVDGDTRKVEPKRTHQVLVTQQRPAKQLILTQGSDQVIRQERNPKQLILAQGSDQVIRQDRSPKQLILAQGSDQVTPQVRSSKQVILAQGSDQVIRQERNPKQLILAQGSDQVTPQVRSPKYVLQMPGDRSDGVYYEYVTDK